MKRLFFAIWHHPILRFWREEHAVRALLLLYGGAVFYFVFAAFRLFVGIAYDSGWADLFPAYYLLLFLCRAYLLRARKRYLVKREGEKKKAAMQIQKNIGLLLFAVNITMIGRVIQVAVGGKATAYPFYVAVITAGCGVYLLVSAIGENTRFQRMGDPILSASKGVTVTGALLTAYTFVTDLFFALGEAFVLPRRLFCTLGGVFVLGCAFYISLRYIRTGAQR